MNTKVPEEVRQETPGHFSLKQWLEDRLEKDLKREHPDLREDEIYFGNGDESHPRTIFKHERHHPLALDIHGNAVGGYHAIFVGRDEYLEFSRKQIEAAEGK